MQKLIPALLFVLLALVSCTKSDDDQAKVLNDTWYIAYYEAPEPGTITPVDKTADFTGYTFEFNDNNEWVVNAPGGDITSAYWGQFDNGATVKIKVTDAVAPIDVLVGTWEVLGQTAESLDLKKVPDGTQVDATGITVNFKKQ